MRLLTQAIIMVIVAACIMVWVVFEARKPKNPVLVFVVLTDQSTGCQYLALRNGSGMIKRSDANGRHMGCLTVRPIEEAL